MQTTDSFLPVTLPKRKIHKTPRLLLCDAYTVASNEFESEEAQDKSVYYITTRKLLETIEQGPYMKGDTRWLLIGLGKIVEELFYEPITHEEIDLTKLALAHAQVSTTGLKPMNFPEALWRRVVDEFGGRPPIEIKALPEGSVFYPNEIPVQITSKAKGFGVMAAMFESTLLKIWGPSEMVTQNEHYILRVIKNVQKVYPDMTYDEADAIARMRLHDFGDRAGFVSQESEVLGEAFLYSFAGTDTFAGGYQAWENSGRKAGVFMSVRALAHRNVQSYATEFQCYRKLYDTLLPGEIGSMVADAYDFWTAVEGKPGREGKDDCLLAFALESKATGNGKVVVGRPDSGDPVEQVLWLCRLAMKHGLYEEKTINGKVWRFGTFLKFLEGDGMTWETMLKIDETLMQFGFVPWAWGIYGNGGGKRNYLRRDNGSWKYALSAYGENDTPACKFSETLGKTTLPGPHKLLRSKEALEAKKTVAFLNEPGEDALVLFFDGSNLQKPFGPGMDDDFNTIQKRIREQMKTMPLSLTTEENHNYPATDAVRNKRKELLKKYAPKKLSQNY